MLDTVTGSTKSARIIGRESPPARIITPGDPADKVLRFCGSPISVQTRRAERPYIDEFGRSYVYRGLVEEVVIEEWTYNFGPYQFMRLVRIENGRVVEVEPLGYGY